MISFPKRRDLILETQREMGMRNPTGVDGMFTWHTLGKLLLPEKHPAMAFVRPIPSRVMFPGRENIVAAIQSALKIDVDGDDGPQTWSALAQRFDKKTEPAHPPQWISREGEYEESIRGRSPNRNKGINLCEGIVIHHAAGYYEGTISWCLKPGTTAGYHCLVNTDGRRAILAEDLDCVHHAGQSKWRGKSSCNFFMLGIAFIGNTNTGAMRPSADLTPDEVASACEWIREKMKIHSITRADITTHAAVSPGRKDDTSLRAYQQIMAAL